MLAVAEVYCMLCALHTSVPVGGGFGLVFVVVYFDEVIVPVFRGFAVFFGEACVAFVVGDGGGF